MATDTISFARGAPSADILPVEAVREATARSLESDWERALSYGTGIGHPGLCEWVGREFHGVGAERVMFTNGSMEAAALLFRYMVEPGDRVIVEQPSYDRTLLLLGRTGAEIVGVPLEADGIQLEAFEAALADGPVKLAHVIPNFHNPAGCTLSAAKRERLVELAAEHGFWIFEDDPYRLVSFGDELPPTMLSLDRSERVIHASSFSKTVSPGVRVGYLAGPAEQIQTLAKRGSEHYISPNMLAESMVLELCTSGALARNIEFVNGALAERRDRLVEALREQIPEAEFVVPGGGYFLWLDLADDVDTPRPARGRQAGGRRLRRRPGLHARGRRLEPATLVRERPRRAGRRGRLAAGPGARGAARRRAGLVGEPGRLRRDLRARPFSTKMIENSLYPGFTKRLHPPAARSKRWRGQSEQRRWRMSPIQIIEGSRKLDPVSERNLAQRRFSALAAAVREHEANVRRREFQMRPQDQALYRRLRQICGLDGAPPADREIA